MALAWSPIDAISYRGCWYGVADVFKVGNGVLRRLQEVLSETLMGSDDVWNLKCPGVGLIYKHSMSKAHYSGVDGQRGGARGMTSSSYRVDQ